LTHLWTLPSIDKDSSLRLMEACNITGLVADTLVARGITTVQNAQRFINPDIDKDYSDPCLIPGLNAVADRLEKAIKANKRILVFGDFDVDGLSATALMIRGLKELGVSAQYVIPHRLNEGYGLTQAALSRVFEQEPQLVITVDCGISAKQEVDQMLSMGIEVLITDHHEPSLEVPTGVAVADPKLEDDSPLSILAGAGVALKLMALMGQRFGKPGLWRDLVDLAALGTLADIMPLIGENRALVKAGLALIEASPRPGLAAMLATAQPEGGPLRSTSLSFSLIPRLNAAGRIGDPTLALRLLITDDPFEAQEIASQLEDANNQRRALEAAISEEALRQAKSLVSGQKVMVLAGEGWHEGVRGIVASRVARRLGLPTIVFTEIDGEFRGSGRSVGSINLFDAVERCADLTLRFGGHEAAVGVTVAQDDFAAFKERIEQCLEEEPEEHFLVLPKVDVELGLNQIDATSAQQLELFEPLGKDNPEPLYLSRGVYLKNTRALGAQKNHLSCTVTDGRDKIAGICFGCEDIQGYLSYDGPVDILYHLLLDQWNGRRKPKLKIVRIIKPQQARQQAKPAPPAQDVERLASEICGAPVVLHDSQKQALAALSQGRSVLGIMATGRGKSLIFQTHAAMLALGEKKASVFIYPLRALIADQTRAITQGFARLGCKASALTGENTTAEKDLIFKGLYEGEIDVLLTTPEFFQLHAWRFEQSGRIGFVVFDEAHHIQTELIVGREAYHHLRQCKKMIAGAQFLAVTATSDDRITKGICEALEIDTVIVDDAQRENLLVDDARNIKDREHYLAAIVEQGSKSIVYINSRAQAVELTRFLRKRSGGMGKSVAFYHAGLKKEERHQIEDMFRNGELMTIISTNAFGEGVNIPDVSHVVLYHLPFSDVAFNQMSGRAGRNGQEATIHLVFGEDDAEINRQILAPVAPERSDLVVVYKAIKALAPAQTPARVQQVSLVQLAKACGSIQPKRPLEDKGILNCLGIFQELGLLAYEVDGTQLTVTVSDKAQRVELSSSCRYLEGTEELLLFEQFRQWVFGATVDELRERIIGPLTPTMRDER